MLIGFSLSPGGLLLPYHLGVLASLDHRFISHATPLAGASAGAIAVASHASGVPPQRTLEASIRVSSHCYNPLFVPAGKLMGALRHEMDGILPPDAHHVINERQGLTVLAHRELYPKPKSRLVTQFDTRECLMDAVCDSSMFPFFTSNKVARAVRRRNEAHHRLVVDGIFAVSPERLGCPDFDEVEHDGRERYVIKRGKVEVGEKPERTVMVSCFPTELLSLSTNAKNDVIGSKLNLNNPIGHAASLVKMACLASSRKELVKLYERGWKDGEEWAKKEEQRKALAELQCVGG
eukprot:CAMPEP_0197719970 /NCGR_PEP_ID=MMETSP1434-20131217/3494_1 /TAXON_ID=265543 /ORGANISM="Minutocellus polymorphus, Strain CCMP3303" /LENGTH=291 /DNA_ID=CAMNT_0043304763 /DNA_START=117 /DNA_END=992 /DNA_ORIENTATION=-